MSAPEVPVLIVGGGVAGCSLAFALAERGVTATLVDRGRVGSLGASAVGAALLNPYRGRSAKPGRYDLQGLDAFWKLCETLERSGFEPGAHRSGVLRVASSERQARAWRDLPGLRECLDLPAPYRAPHGAFLVPSGGWVEPRRLLAALVRASRTAGAVVIEECGLETIERTSNSWLAHTQRGTVTARAVALCPGAEVVPGVALPELERIAGDQITLRAEVDLPYPLAGSVYLAGDGGQVFIGGNHREPETQDPRAPELLRASAARMVPQLAAAPVERVWTGVRAKRPDNVPLLQQLEPNLWYLGGFGGRGFLTAPLLAGRLAKLLNQ